MIIYDIHIHSYPLPYDIHGVFPMIRPFPMDFPKGTSAQGSPGVIHHTSSSGVAQALDMSKYGWGVAWELKVDQYGITWLRRLHA